MCSFSLSLRFFDSLVCFGATADGFSQFTVPVINQPPADTLKDASSQNFMLEVGGKHFSRDTCPESWHIKLLRLLGPWIGLCFYCFWTQLARSTNFTIMVGGKLRKTFLCSRSWRSFHVEGFMVPWDVSIWCAKDDWWWFPRNRLISSGGWADVMNFVYENCVYSFCAKIEAKVWLGLLTISRRREEHWEGQ